jgi:hypothetical protein
MSEKPTDKKESDLSEKVEVLDKWNEGISITVIMSPSCK